MKMHRRSSRDALLRWLKRVSRRCDRVCRLIFTPAAWSDYLMIDEPRLTVSLLRTFRSRFAHQPKPRVEFVPCKGGSDGHTNCDGSHRRYPAQFRCEERRSAR